LIEFFERLHILKTMNCIRCTSTTLHKNGILPSGWQRWRCFDCDKQFSVWGKRWTYTETFKADVIDEYCHSDKTARQVVADHHISSATLIKWKKEHTW